MYRVGRLLYVVVPIVLVLYIVLTETKNTNRDEARKYQACTQRVVAVASQNALSDALRSALGSSIQQRREQASRTADRDIRRGLLENATELERSRLAVRSAPVPDCRRAYPRGFEQSHKYPDLVPARPPSTSTPKD